MYDEIPALDEMADVPVEDWHEISEQDVDWLAEIAEADEEAEHQWEYRQEVQDCCQGRDWRCGHYGHGR